MFSSLQTTLRRLFCLAPIALALAACNDSYDNAGYVNLPASCSVADQQTWLQGYFDDQYFFYANSPKNVAHTPDMASFFNALLYTGGDSRFPPTMTDVWSRMSSDDAFDRYYGAGQALGWGVFVNGIEVQGQTGQTLYVTFVDPGSPAAAQGIARGDQVTAINGVPAATVMANNDYTGLAAASVGQTLVLDTHNAGGDHHLSLLSAAYDLNPVQGTQILTTGGGRKVGYLMVTDMLDQALSPYDSAFAQFKAAAVQDVVIDLRYNSGGFFGVGEILASYPAASTTTNRVYGYLTFNARHPEQDAYYTFDGFTSAISLPRVYVLTGPRTCAAAEQLVNGLSPYVPVITVGSATCGKPFGATPVSACSTTYNVMTFEATNTNGQAVDVAGITPTCPVAEDFTQPLGAGAEPLLHAAMQHADTGACPAATPNAARSGVLRSHWMEPNQRQGLLRH